MGRKAWRAFPFLLLAGVLLLAAPTAATSWDTKDFKVSGGGEGEGIMCQERCERRHRGDWWGKQRCLMDCGKSRDDQEEAGGGSLDAAAAVDDVDRHDRGQCQKLCSHFHDYHRKLECLRRCLHGPQAEDDNGGSLGDAADVNRHGHHHRGQCEKLCSHFHDYHRKMECLRRCLHGRLQADGGADNEIDNGDGGGGSLHAAVVDDVNRHGHDRGQCQKLCSHFHDYHRKLECLQRCLHGLQLQEETSSVHGGADDDDNNRDDGGGDRCEKQCQHYHDYDKRQQCVHHCRGGGGLKTTTVVGAILEVV